MFIKYYLYILFYKYRFVNIIVSVFFNIIFICFIIVVLCLLLILKDCFCLFFKLNEDCVLLILLVGLIKIFMIKLLLLEILLDILFEWLVKVFLVLFL